MKSDKGFIIALIAVFIYMFLGLLIVGYTYEERYRAVGVGIDKNEEVVSKVKPQYLIYNKNFM